MGASTVLDQLGLLLELLAAAFARKRLTGLRVLARSMFIKSGAVLEGFTAIGAHERGLAGVPIPDVVLEGNLLREGFIAKFARQPARFVVSVQMTLEVGKVDEDLSALEASEILPLLVNTLHVFLKK